jgi:hypothetical protein
MPLRSAAFNPKLYFFRDNGSILLLTVVLLSLLSVLFLLAANSVLLGTNARESLQASLEMLYIAEAGVAHGQAFCTAHGETSPALATEASAEGEEAEPGVEDPFGLWLPFAGGEYRLKSFRLEAETQPYVDRDSGILIVSTARLNGEGRRRVCLLLDDPPSCRTLSWWEPE